MSTFPGCHCHWSCQMTEVPITITFVLTCEYCYAKILPSNLQTVSFGNVWAHFGQVTLRNRRRAAVCAQMFKLDFCLNMFWLQLRVAPEPEQSTTPAPEPEQVPRPLFKARPGVPTVHEVHSSPSPPRSTASPESDGWSCWNLTMVMVMVISN